MSHMKTAIALLFMVTGITMISQAIYSIDLTTAALEGGFGVALVFFIGVPILVSHVKT